MSRAPTLGPVCSSRRPSAGGLAALRSSAGAVRIDSVALMAASALVVDIGDSWGSAAHVGGGRRHRGGRRGYRRGDQLPGLTSARGGSPEGGHDFPLHERLGQLTRYQ